MNDEMVLKLGSRDLGWVTSDSRPFSRWWGRQRLEHHTLRDGLSVSLFCFDQTGSVDIHERQTEGNSLALSVCLDGACEMLWEQQIEGTRSQVFQAGTSVLWYGPNPGGWARVNQRLGFSTVRIDIAPSLLRQWFDGEPNRFLPELSGLLRSPSQAEFMLLQPASSRLVAVARALLEARTRDGVERMMFESRTLELVAAFLDGQRVLEPHEQLSQVDSRRVQAARELLEERMADPPSLGELARLVGTNEYKLKRGFKAMYGRPVFRWLHELRLERGRALLASGQCTVTEVALAVGFSKPCWFAHAFRARYGVAPKAFAQGCRRVVRVTSE